MIITTYLIKMDQSSAVKDKTGHGCLKNMFCLVLLLFVGIVWFNLRAMKRGDKLPDAKTPKAKPRLLKKPSVPDLDSITKSPKAKLCRQNTCGQVNSKTRLQVPKPGQPPKMSTIPEISMDYSRCSPKRKHSSSQSCSSKYEATFESTQKSISLDFKVDKLNQGCVDIVRQDMVRLSFCAQVKRSKEAGWERSMILGDSTVSSIELSDTARSSHRISSMPIQQKNKRREVATALHKTISNVA